MELSPSCTGETSLGVRVWLITNTNWESLCYLIFSTSCRAAKIISTHPDPFLNPHWESGRIPSAICCSCSSMTLARSLPITWRRLMPHQLSQTWKSPFFEMGKITASRQSLATFCSSNTFCLSSSSLSHNSVAEAEVVNSKGAACYIFLWLVLKSFVWTFGTYQLMVSLAICSYHDLTSVQSIRWLVRITT